MGKNSHNLVTLSTGHYVQRICRFQKQKKIFHNIFFSVKKGKHQKMKIDI
jgi:hypothetical protein